jgi:hypothetical protein
MLDIYAREHIGRLHAKCHNIHPQGTVTREETTSQEQRTH